MAALVLMAAAARGGGSAEAAFTDGMREFAAGNWDRSFALLESALEADPDNLRYGSEYRQTVLSHARALHPKEGKPADFDRALKLFEQLAAAHPGASNAHLNRGFAFVDKIPAAGAITQVILANSALESFTRAVEARASWIGYYTRGVSYLFWPKIFGRAKLGVADLEAALRMQQAGPKKPYHVRTWIALGDGYWKTDEPEKARAVWAAGLKEFPASEALRVRLEKRGDDLAALIADALDPNRRIDTDLRELWGTP